MRSRSPSLGVPTMDQLQPVEMEEIKRKNDRRGWGDSGNPGEGMTSLLRSCRLLFKPYLPPPVISSIRAIDDHFDEKHDFPEASMTFLFTLLIAIGWLQVLRLLTRRIGQRLDGEDDDYDDVLPSSSRRVDDSRDLVLLCGAPYSGKTTLFHALCRRRSQQLPEEEDIPSSLQTVMSMKAVEGTVFHQERNRDESDEGRNSEDRVDGDDDDVGSVRLIDYPGHVRLRHNLARVAAAADRIVLVVDATRPVRDSADILFLLLTSPIVQNSWSKRQGRREYEKVPLMCVCSKSDLPGAKNCQRIKLQLRTELDRTRRTIMATASSKKGMGGDVDADEDEEEKALPLGVPGKALDLDSCQDLPCQFSFAAASCVVEQMNGKKLGISEVLKFVLHGS